MDLLDIAKKNTKKKQFNEAPLYVKLISLLSVVRGYNILIIVIAQYLAAIFIFAPRLRLKDILLNVELYFLVLATSCVIAAGYIINNFYDNKYPLIGLFSVVILTILPFFAVFVFYKNFSTIIFTHASFLFFILTIRELVKSLENIKGDMVQNKMTIPLKYGENFTKIIITIIVLLTLDPIYFLWKYPEIGDMKYYFYLAGLMLAIFTIKLWWRETTKNYVQLHILLKILIVLGVFSLALINTSVIIKRLINL